uniref:Protein phosphatase n=1 Tax=Chaetoceros debilis TaxID=122233 RepID=A0A6S8TDN2_9STRA|mmetsp:Transcript_6389/g.9357  ORF Transcript_6389/g.9357 Transcript_6389/m.9357 type:complete len:529 (+) Transcript_6389:276-1862(+)
MKTMMLVILSSCIFHGLAFTTNSASRCGQSSRVSSTDEIVQMMQSNFDSRSRNSRGRHHTSSSTRLRMSNLEVLAKEGPWTAYLDDESTGLVYYFNTDSGESSWDPPTSTFPPIKLTPMKQQRMLAKRNEYNAKMGIEGTVDYGLASEIETKNSGGGGLFGNLFAPVQTMADPEPAVEEFEEEEIELPKSTSLFGTLFGKKSENYNQEQFEDAKPVEEAYNQELLEDANPVEEDTNQGPAKPSFVSDLMSMASFQIPKATSDEQVQGEAAPNVETSPSLKMQMSSKVMPHPEKVSWGGEDALFVSSRSFGVFDGVSGAEKLAGVPLYSNTLAQQFKSEVKLDSPSLSIEEMKSKLLSAARYADASATGASTALVASIGEDDILRTVNLGDCQLMVIRNQSIFARTRETTHYFECPYQLSENSPDRPKDATILSTKLSSGDVILAGSDGVFDNLDDATVIEIATAKNSKGMISPSAVANKIISESRRISLDTQAETPFAKVAKKNRLENYADGLGGKVDDISCVVVSVN